MRECWNDGGRRHIGSGRVARCATGAEACAAPGWGGRSEQPPGRRSAVTPEGAFFQYSNIPFFSGHRFVLSSEGRSPRWRRHFCLRIDSNESTPSTSCLAMPSHCARLSAAHLDGSPCPLRTGHLPDPKEVGQGSPTLPRRPAAAGENVAIPFLIRVVRVIRMLKSDLFVYSRSADGVLT